MKMPEYVAVKIMPDKKGTSYNLKVVTDADFVNVVRCKDCKYRPKKDGYFNDFCPCATTGDPYLDWIPEDDWYCASGEKVEQ